VAVFMIRALVRILVRKKVLTFEEFEQELQEEMDVKEGTAETIRLSGSALRMVRSFASIMGPSILDDVKEKLLFQLENDDDDDYEDEGGGEDEGL